MSVSRPARCLWCRMHQSVSRPLIQTRSFHATLSRPRRRRPKHASLPAYDAEEKAQLKEKYTAEQLNALEAGEEAISADDLIAQGAFRNDPFAFDYLDDFSKVKPVIDRRIPSPESNYDPNLRFKTEDEHFEDLARFYQNLPDDLSDDEARLAMRKFDNEVRWTVGQEAAERAPRTYLAPELTSKINDPGVRYPEHIEGLSDPTLIPVLQHTGFTPDDVKRFRFKHLVMHRVVNQTRMGKIQSLYTLTVVGDGKGLLGVGEGKSTEADEAKRMSSRSAIRNMQPIHRYEGRTIYGDVEGKVGAAVVKIMARPPGFGVRCQHYIFEMCRCAGITDLAARVTRSRNPMNVVKATFEALRSQKLPDEIARARGKKLVDVRKVYYGGQV